MHFRHDKMIPMRIGNADSNDTIQTCTHVSKKRENKIERIYVCETTIFRLRKHRVHMRSANICFNMFLCCWQRLFSLIDDVCSFSLNVCVCVLRFGSWTAIVCLSNTKPALSRERDKELACERGVQCFVRAYSNSSQWARQWANSRNECETSHRHTHTRTLHTEAPARHQHILTAYSTHSRPYDMRVWDTNIHTDMHTAKSVRER